MRKFIYETTVPGILIPEHIDIRVNLWKSAGIDTVFLCAYDGRGATWPSSLMPQDSRVDPNSAVTLTKYLRKKGIKVVLTFDFIGLYNPTVPIKPEYLLDATHYDIWNTNFVAWRTSVIEECLKVCPCYAVAIDYIRSVNEVSPSGVSAKEAVKNAIGAIRSVTLPYPFYTINHLRDAQNLKQGIYIQEWKEEGLIDGYCLFHYEPSWPRIDFISSENLWLLSDNFTTIAGVTNPKSDIEVARKAQSVIRRSNPYGYGLFTANMLTEDQSYAIAWL